MSSQHTPGPWTVRSEKFVVAKRGEHEGEILIAPTYWMEHVPQEAAANARLIAAAPELYEALVRLMHNLPPNYPEDENDSHEADKDRALAAIAKATGSTT